MKILFAIKDMNNAKGGAERVLSQVASGLAKKGHDVSLLTYDRLGGKSYYPLDKGVKRISLGIGKSQERANFNETLGRIKAIRRVLQVRKPDIVIPFMHSSFIPVSLASAGLGIPIIASEHIVPMHYKTRPAQFLLLLLSTFFISQITVLSPNIRRLYPKIVRRKMVVMPNPVEPPMQEFRQESNNRKTILNVGRLDEQKDQKTLIRAFSDLAPVYPDWDIKIFGEGPLRPFLQNLIKRHSLQNRVFLMGTTPNIGAEYAKADIFAMPSKYESFGLATAEAMSYGVPSVGFAECPGTNELISHNKNGLLVSKRKKNRIEVFKWALELLMKDEGKRAKLGFGAISEVKKFHPDIIIGQWEHLVEKYV